MTASDSAPRGVPRADATERFLIEYGFLPGKKHLEQWMGEQRISLARSDTTYSADVAALRRRRGEKGRWTPPRPLDTRTRRKLLALAEHRPSAASSGPLPRRQSWSDEEIIDGLAKALREMAELNPPVNFAQRTYKAFCAGRRDLPGYSAIGRCAKRRNTTVEAIRSEAARRLTP